MIKTAYSFRKAVGSIKDIEARLKEIGWSHFPIADIGNSWGFHEISMKPIYGATLYVTNNLDSEKPKYAEIVVYAKNKISEITKLISLATAQFRYIPLLHYNQIPDNLTVIWGNGTKFELVPSKEKYVALNASINKLFLERAVSASFKPVATQINTYPSPRDRAFYETLCGMNSDTNTYPQHILSDEEFKASLIWTSDYANEAIALRNHIFNDHEGITIPKGELYDVKSEKTLREICFEEMQKRGLDYKDRLEFELSVINQKGFDNYFLIVKALIDYAKDTSLVGPGRGSAAGSLVAYLLGITNVDPVKHNLLFFRFMDPNRTDFPDIDTDIASIARRDVISFAERHFGEDHVACVGALASFQANNTIQEFARTYELPFSEFENLKKMVPEYAAGDNRSDNALSEALDIEKKTLKKYPEMEVLRKFGGSPRQSTTHAGGVLISNAPLYEYTVIDSRYVEKRTANVDLKTAEKLNLLKIDLLGLKALSIYEEALKQAKLPKRTLYDLDFSDDKVFSLLDDGRYTGIFQIEGNSVWNFAKRVKFRSLEDLATISAIARPGPMASGDAERWLRRHNGEEAISYPHPVLKPYLEDTLGVLVYQEQVMLIAKEVANMSWEQVAKLRKVIAKSMGEEAFRPYSEPFIAGLVASGVPENVAVKFWQDILGFGSYSFNRCLSGDTMIRIARPNKFLPKEVSIERLYQMYEESPTQSVNDQGRKPTLVSLFPNDKGFPQKAVKIIKSGKQECFKYTFDDGSFVSCTKNHRFIVNGEWKEIGEANVGDIFTSLNYTKTSFINGKGYDKNAKTLVSIEFDGEKETYDIEMPTHHNFTLANGLVAHNCHSLAYGMISYWSLWLKYHHPLEFFAATLTYQEDLDKQIKMLREAVKEGYEYIPVDRDSSITKWTVKNGKLLGPLQNIEGIALGNANKILSAREDPQCNLSARLDKLLTNPATPYDDLYPVKKKLESLDIWRYSRVTKPLEDATPNGDWQEGVYILGEIEFVAIRDENDEKRVQERLTRGQIGEYKGETRFVEIRLKDDTINNYYVKIGRKEFRMFENILYDSDGKYLVKEGDCLFVKGTICPEAPVFLAKNLVVGR